MGKTYIDTVKYLVYANIEISGLVEKPDVVGAIFGQTEGLLGDELDLRDLQKNGRIGRIEVDLAGREGRCNGLVKIPSSLDMVETCIIAAALETVDRVGPCEASIRVTKVEDTRNAKRKVLLDRAKNLLKNLLTHEIPESKEISDLVREEVRTAEITEYGEDKLPSGPNIERVKEIVLVEGRADVINLLKNDITNVVAVQGAKVPNSIIHLSKGKEVTVFLDGDRGGDIILNELVQCGVEIDFVARAPAGKEVEELMRKELIKCLRNRVPFEQAQDQKREERDNRNNSKRRFPERSQMAEKRDERQAAGRFGDVPQATRPEFAEEREKQDAPTQSQQTVRQHSPLPVHQPQAHHQQAQSHAVTGEAPRKLDKEELAKELDELNNTLRARFYNENRERIGEMPVRDVIKALEETQGVQSIVFDGIITQRLVDLANNKGVKTLVGVKIGNVNKTPADVEIITKAR